MVYSSVSIPPMADLPLKWLILGGYIVYRYCIYIYMCVYYIIYIYVYIYNIVHTHIYVYVHVHVYVYVYVYVYIPLWIPHSRPISDPTPWVNLLAPKKRYASAAGLLFQYTASTLPTMAIQTTLTADGTRTLKASRSKRNVEGLMIPSNHHIPSKYSILPKRFRQNE